MRSAGECYQEAIETDKKAAEIENKLALPDKVDKEAYLLEIAAYTLMKIAFETLLNEKKEVQH